MRLIVLLALLWLPQSILAVIPPDFCQRKPEHPKCLAPTPSPTPTSSSPTASPVPTSAPSASPTPSIPSGNTVDLEAQAWWNRDGLSVPDAVGHHIHVRVFNWPAEGRIITGTYTLRARVTLHDQVGSTSRIRYGDGFDGSVEKTIPFVMAGCSDCSRDVDIPVDFGSWQTGRREFRISVFVDDEQPDVAGDQRMNQSTGWQVCVRSCDSPSRTDAFYTEARGWYTDHEYANAKLTTSVAAVAAGATIGVRLGPGSGGLPTKYAGVFIDPDFHHGSAGIVVKTWTAAFTGSVTLPTLPAGPHRLVLVSSDGKNAGVLALPFEVQ